MAATRQGSGDDEFCPEESVAAIVAGAGDTLERILVGPLGTGAHRPVRDDDHARADASTRHADGPDIRNRGERDAAGRRPDRRDRPLRLPELDPPSVAIADGPAEGATTGPDVDFRFEITPGPQDDGDVVLRCRLDGRRRSRAAPRSSSRISRRASMSSRCARSGSTARHRTSSPAPGASPAPAAPPPAVEPARRQSSVVPLPAPVGARVRAHGRRVTVRAAPGTRSASIQAPGHRSRAEAARAEHGTVGARPFRRTVRLTRADRRLVRRALRRGRRPIADPRRVDRAGRDAHRARPAGSPARLTR